MSNDDTNEAPKKTSKPKGFAAMDPERVKEYARRGGKAAHEAGTAHQFTSAEAKEAGRRGGRATHAKMKSKAGRE